MSDRKRIVVLGAGGFIGGHMARKLKSQGHWVRGVDIKPHEYFNLNDELDEFLILDLTNFNSCFEALSPLEIAGTAIPPPNTINIVYQFAADMGGAEYIFSGDNDANIMLNSASINLNVLKCMVKLNINKVFYSSSACVYPESSNYNCEESSAYPANPDSEYGWEKIFSERLYLAFKRNYNLDVKIARFHNIFGPYGTWRGGKEKAPAAICRKVLNSCHGVIDIFGDGNQTRSFLYIDECIEGVLKLMESDISGPINIGSEEMVTINQLVEYVASFDNTNIEINYIDGPLGVRGRNSHNKMIYEMLGWKPTTPLKDGLKITYEWIKSLINNI